MEVAATDAAGFCYLFHLTFLISSLFFFFLSCLVFSSFLFSLEIIQGCSYYILQHFPDGQSLRFMWRINVMEKQTGGVAGLAVTVSILYTELVVRDEKQSLSSLSFHLIIPQTEAVKPTLQWLSLIYIGVSQRLLPCWIFQLWEKCLVLLSFNCLSKGMMQRACRLLWGVCLCVCMLVCLCECVRNVHSKGLMEEKAFLPKYFR